MICSWICNISRAPARPSHFRTTFVSSPIQFTIHLWKFVEGYHTTFVTVFIPPSFYQNFPATCQSTNSKISHFSQLSQLSQLSPISPISSISQPSRLSPLSQPSRLSPLSTPSPKIHGLFNDNIWRHQNIRACEAMAVGQCDKSGIFIL